MAGGFNLDQIINDPSFVTGMGLLGAGSGRPNAMAAFNVLDTNRKFAEAQKLNAAKIEQEKAQTGMMGQQVNLYGQEVEQRRAQTQLLQQQLQRQQAQWEMGMKFLQQIRPDLAGAVQPPVQVQPAPNAPPVTVPGPPNIPAAQQAASLGKYGTPNLILDNLMKVESGGNPRAIGPTIPGSNERAMGPFQFLPSTINELRQDGITFDPFNVEQSRNAADYLLQKRLKANGGDWNKTIASYGGFKAKDPTAYIQKVTAGFSGSPEAQAAASVQQSSTQAELARLSAQAAAARRDQQAAGVMRFMLNDPAGLTEAAKAGAPDYKPFELGLQAGGQAETQRHNVVQENQGQRRLDIENKNAEARSAEVAMSTAKAQQARTQELAQMEMGHTKIANSMDRAQKQVDELLNSPGLNAITGFNAITNKFAIPGTPAYGALNKLESIKAKLVNDTLQSVREGMKNNASGYGSFTEKELGVIQNYLEALDPASPTFKEDLLKVRNTLGDIRNLSGKYLEAASGGAIKPRVRVKKDGKEFTVPASQLDEAIKSGYEKVQ